MNPSLRLVVPMWSIGSPLGCVTPIEFQTNTQPFGSGTGNVSPNGTQPGSRGVSLNDGTASDLSRTISYWKRTLRSSFGSHNAFTLPLKMSSPPTSSPLPCPDRPAHWGRKATVGPYVAPFA